MSTEKTGDWVSGDEALRQGRDLFKSRGIAVVFEEGAQWASRLTAERAIVDIQQLEGTQSCDHAGEYRDGWDAAIYAVIKIIKGGYKG